MWECEHTHDEFSGCVYHCKALGKGKDAGLYEKLNNSWVKARRWAERNAE